MYKRIGAKTGEQKKDFLYAHVILPSPREKNKPPDLQLRRGVMKRLSACTSQRSHRVPLLLLLLLLPRYTRTSYKESHNRRKLTTTASSEPVRFYESDRRRESEDLPEKACLSLMVIEERRKRRHTYKIQSLLSFCFVSSPSLSFRASLSMCRLTANMMIVTMRFHDHLTPPIFLYVLELIYPATTEEQRDTRSQTTYTRVIRAHTHMDTHTHTHNTRHRKIKRKNQGERGEERKRE